MDVEKENRQVCLSRVGPHSSKGVSESELNWVLILWFFSLGAVQTLKPTWLQLGPWSRSRFSSPVGLCVARPSHSHLSLLSLCLLLCYHVLPGVPHQVLGLLQSQEGSVSHVRVQDLLTFLVCLPAVGNLSWSHPTPSSCPSPEVCILFIGLHMCLPVA